MVESGPNYGEIATVAAGTDPCAKLTWDPSIPVNFQFARTQSQVNAIERAYRSLFGRELSTDLSDELNAAELRRLAALAPQERAAAAPQVAAEPAVGEGGDAGSAGPERGGAMALTPALAAAAERTNRAELAARRLRSAMAGMGTDEDAIFAVLTGRSRRERRAIADFYALTYHRTLESDLRDEMSGSELTEALRLLGEGELSSADELYQAITGLGTDESRIMRVLSATTGAARINRMIAEYARRYGSLLVALHGDLSGSELADALNHLGRAGNLQAIREVIAGGEPDMLHHIDDFTIVSVADRLRLVARVHTETIVGPSDEGVLERIWSAPDMAEAAAQNQSLYGSSRNRGAETPEELDTFGRFENHFEQNMFEGGITAADGIFDWTLVGDVLNVRVPINFQPANGVVVPWGTWRSHLDNVWNQYAIQEPGGRKIRLQFAMVNDSSASRTVAVVKNKIPGGPISQEDRANAGMFYEVMRASTVPHEFGHFIGLPDEYHAPTMTSWRSPAWKKPGLTTNQVRPRQRSQTTSTQRSMTTPRPTAASR
jgi:hypothetical protein